MALFVVLMFLVALLFAVIAVLIYKGKTELIHDYHRTRVEDHAAYGRAFGKAMGIIAAACGVSGMIGLLGEAPWVVITAVAVAVAGLVAGIVALVIVQKKHNDGIF